ncbi:unnamed protein product, partial [Amoebophrya sp. A25]|eukprot:GSA25T00015498001.1
MTMTGGAPAPFSPAGDVISRVDSETMTTTSFPGSGGLLQQPAREDRMSMNSQATSLLSSAPLVDQVAPSTPRWKPRHDIVVERVESAGATESATSNWVWGQSGHEPSQSFTPGAFTSWSHELQGGLISPTGTMMAVDEQSSVEDDQDLAWLIALLKHLQGPDVLVRLFGDENGSRVLDLMVERYEGIWYWLALKVLDNQRQGLHGERDERKCQSAGIASQANKNLQMGYRRARATRGDSYET